MPSAVGNFDKTRYELKSLQDGFVELKSMTYGEVVQRRALMKLSLEMGGGKQKDFKGEMAMASVEIQLYEFQHSIFDHNLEDTDGRKLNLGVMSDFLKLDSKVGSEIEKLISNLNGLDDIEDDEVLGNSPSGA